MMQILSLFDDGYKIQSIEWREYATQSPILYMGNKYRLIRRGLVNLFPSNIKNFVDVFSGSAVVSMNTKAESYYLNDIDKIILQYYDLFKNHSAVEIIAHIKKQIVDYDLPTKAIKRGFIDKNVLERQKIAYHRFRDSYNQSKNILDLYTLMFFAFSQQFRVNKDGDFNMPLGNNCFSSQNEQAIHKGIYFFKQPNIHLSNRDFEVFLNGLKLENSDFVYFDPPYSHSLATYNERNNKWDKNDDLRLLAYCAKLNQRGIKFGISNIFTNNNAENALLKDFCKENALNVFSPSSFTYSACGKGNKSHKEVFICNYEVTNNNHNFVALKD